ncbi:hypothetical protein ACJX0J_015751, partial [Zea mays]
YAIANELYLFKLTVLKAPSHTAAHHLFLAAFLVPLHFSFIDDYVAVLRSLWGNMYSLNHFT